MATFTDKYPPPFDRDTDDYKSWKRDFELWQSITESPKAKQGVLVSLRLDKVTRDEVCDEITNAELITEQGVQKVIEKLDKIFKPDPKLTAYEAYENFETYKRQSNVSITEFCKEFEARLKKVTDDGTKIADHILAYRLIKSAQLSDSQIHLMKATTSEMTYKEVSTQLKKIFKSNLNAACIKEENIKVEPYEQSTHYGGQFRKSNFKKGSANKKFENQRFDKKDKKKSLKKRGKNPLDQYGRVTRCIHCESINHWIKDCPDMTSEDRSLFLEKIRLESNSDQDSSDEDDEEKGPIFEVNHATAGTENFYDPIKVTLSCKTMSSAVLDCGAPKTVCGRLWLLQYIEGLSGSDRSKIIHKKSKNVFKFGCGTKYPAYECVMLPAKFGSKEVMIETDVVEGDIPLLFGKEAMKKAGANLDCKNDTLRILGETLNLEVTESGHYALPLGKERQTIADMSRGVDPKLTLVMKNMSDKEMAIKLHRQFAHPSSERLIKLVENQGQDCKTLLDAIRDVTKNCKVCALYKKPAPRPVVGFPLATRFGEVVAMDLKQFGKVYLLHAIDHATRFCAGSIIRSKTPEVIIRDVFKYWISVFGTPEKILTDNGGEFCNQAMMELGEKFNLKLITTAAESPWSNGLVERHNLIMGEMITKTQSDTGCSLEMATMWSVCAHNSLANIHGFTPFQLVFGRNPVLPCLQTDKPPALDSDTTCEMIRNNLNSMHAARQAHIRSESSEKVKRALSHNVRTSGEIKYVTGDHVYYKRLDSKKWRGPGVVIGQDGKQVLVKHQGIYVRVHPCRLTLENQTIVGLKENFQNTHTGDSESENQNTHTGDSEDKNQNTHTGDSVTGKLNTHTGDSVNNSQNTHRGDSERFNLDVDSDSGSDDQEGLDVSQLSHQESSSNLNGPELENFENSDSETESDGSDIVNEADRETSLEDESLQVNRDENDHTNEQQACQAMNQQSRPKLTEKKSQLKQGARVRFKKDDDKEWTCAVLGKRAGKIGGVHENCWNLTKDSGELEAVDFKKEVKEWQLLNEDPQIEDAREVFLTQDYVIKNDEEKLNAMKKELASWKTNNVYEEVENTGQEYITGKWVITPKIIDGKHSVKARYVLRGFEEPKEFRTDSPMCMKSSVRLLLATLSSCKWNLGSIDFKTAFLQGEPIVREVYMRPPKEANTDKLWKLMKTVYGLRDAPRQWYLRVKAIICELGCTVSTIDNSLFMLHQSLDLVGIISVFVDDILYGGTSEFLHNVIENLKNRLVVGTEQSIAFKYVGIHFEQKKDFTIRLDQDSYIDNLKTIDISEQRLLEKSDGVTKVEKEKLRRTIGQLNWLFTMSRPDIGFTIGQISLSEKRATVADIYNANKLVSHVKNTKTSILFPHLNLKHSYLQVYTDASYGNLKDGGSQGGYIIFLTDGVNFCPIEWRSCRVKRVVKSIMAAETLALAEGLEAAYVVGKLCGEVFHRSPENYPMRVVGITDNKSLVDTAYSSSILEDRRLLIDMAIIRQMINRGEIELKWVSSDNQVSDVLTKWGASGVKLRAMLSSGRN